MRTGRDIARDLPLHGSARVAQVAMLATHVAMETKEKVVVRRFLIGVVSEGDLALIDDLVAPDCVFHHPDAAVPIEGHESLRQFISGLRIAFADLKLEVTHMLAEGNQVAARVTCTGTQTGPFMGSAPTNKQATWTATNFIRMEDDKIQEAWVGEDTLSLLKQLGLITGR